MPENPNVMKDVWRGCNKAAERQPLTYCGGTTSGATSVSRKVVLGDGIEPEGADSCGDRLPDCAEILVDAERKRRAVTPLN